MTAKKTAAPAKKDPLTGSTRYEYTGPREITVYSVQLGKTLCLSKGQVIDSPDFGGLPDGNPDFKKVGKSAKLTNIGDMIPKEAS